MSSTCRDCGSTKHLTGIDGVAFCLDHLEVGLREAFAPAAGA
jgi:hypothetical protein